MLVLPYHFEGDRRMNRTHDHRLIVETVNSGNDIDQWTLGCHVCGPQLVLSVNWDNMSARLAWVHATARVVLEHGGRAATAGSTEDGA